MPVGYDTVGPSASGTAFTTATAGSPATWSHTNSAADNALIVGITIFTGNSNTITSVKYGATQAGAVALSFLGFVPGNNSSGGGIALYGKAGGLPAGANTVYVVASDSDNHNAGSISLTGAGSLGNPVTNYSSAASVTVNVTNTTTGGMIVAACSYGGTSLITITGNNNVTARWFHAGSTNSGSDNGASGTVPSTGGGATQTVGFADTGSDWWGIVAVEVLPGAEIQGKDLSDQGQAGEILAINGEVAPQAIDFPDSGTGTEALGGISPPCLSGLAEADGFSYFIDGAGQPILFLADNPWAILSNAGRWSGTWQSTLDDYLNARGAQKFTAIYFDPYGNLMNNCVYDNGNTWDNVAPFTSWNVNGPVLNESFFSRLDYMLDGAERNGITLFINIAYTGTGDIDNPPGCLYNKTSAQYTGYGTALAARYSGRPNIVWVVGNDYYDTFQSQFTNMRDGLRAGGDNHLFIVHNHPESTEYHDTTDNSAMNTGTAIGEANWVYVYVQSYFGIEYAYSEAIHSTVLFGDGYFYQGGSGSYDATHDRVERQLAWWVLSSGGRGLNTGSEGIWQWSNTAANQAVTEYWYTTCAGKIRDLVESLPDWWLLIPDISNQLVTAGRGARRTTDNGVEYGNATTDSYVTASRTPGGSLALIYLSHASTITIDQTKMGAGYTATWVDPDSCATYPATEGSTYNSGAADGSKPVNNNRGQPDWVLVLQAPSLTVDTADPMPAGAQGEAYDQDLAASGGTAPYTWTLESGSLPDGLVLS